MELWLHWNPILFGNDSEIQMKLNKDLISVIESNQSEALKKKEINDLILSGAFINCQLENNDTPLHIAVNKKEIQVIEILLKNGADIYFKNYNGESPLDVARYINSPIIIDMLNTPTESLNSLVRQRMKEFVGYFVLEFEAKLISYQMILNGEAQEADQSSYTFSGRIGQISGGMIGGLIGYFIGMSSQGVQVGAKICGEMSQRIGNAIDKKNHAHTAVNISAFIDCFKNDRENFRIILAEIGLNIFQSFEMQFMHVTTDKGPNKAMRKLAIDAVNRTIYYISKHNVKHISDGIILGKSKIEPYMGIPCVTTHLKKPGFQIYFNSNKTEIKCKTSHIYDNVGIVIENDNALSMYYTKNDCKYNAMKYGYRRCLLQENWKKEKHMYKVNDEVDQFSKYQYILRQEHMRQELKNIIHQMNFEDHKFENKRIRKLLTETTSEILKEIRDIRVQSQGCEDDCNKLLDFERNLKKLDMEKYFQEFKKWMEDAKKERHDIIQSIKKGREENIENFINLHETVLKFQTHLTSRQEVDGKTLAEIHKVVMKNVNEKDSKESIWFDAKGPVELFTGRVQELFDLDIMIQRGATKNSVLSQITIISGLGGIGKTELARQYISRNSNLYDKNIIWICAENEGYIIGSFLRLAKDSLEITTMNIDGKEKDIKSIINDVYAYFKNVNCLFVFDNLENEEHLKKYLPMPYHIKPSNKPYILITSRIREWERGIEVLVLSELNINDTIAFVKKGLCIENDSDDKDIMNLANKLQGFPLAIHQAISYTEDRNMTDKFKISDYLNEYEKQNKNLLASKIFCGINNEYTKTTYTTWTITLDKVRSDKEKGELALEILFLVAYIAPENIERNIFFYLSNSNEERVKLAVRLLAKFSIIHCKDNQTKFSIHRLVQEVIRLYLQEKKQEEITLKKVLHILENSLLESDLNNALTAWKFACKYTELVIDYSKLPSNIIMQLIENIRYDEALMFGHDALKSLTDVLGPEHQDTIAAKHTTAIVMRSVGKYNEAIEMFQEVYNQKRKIIDNGIPESINSKYDIALTLFYQNNYVEALKVFQDDFDAKYAKLSSDHPDTLRTMHYIAVVRFCLGENNTLKYVEDLLAKRETILGSDHRDTLKTKAHIGLIYRKQGWLYNALHTYKEVLERRKEVLGPKHRETLNTKQRIAEILNDLGKYNEAIATCEEVNKERKDILYSHNFDYWNSKNDFARILVNQGKYDEALSCFRKVLDQSINVLGPQHPHTIMSKKNVAWGLLKQCKYEEAIQAYLDVLKDSKDIMGPEHQVTLESMSNIAIILRKQGEYEQALNYAQEVLDIRNRIYGQKHKLTMFSKQIIANVLFEQGQFDTALSIYNEVYLNETEILGPSHPDTLLTKSNIAQTLSEQGCYDDSIKCYQDILKEKKKHLLDDLHPEIMTIKSKIAFTLEKQGSCEEAFLRYNEVLAGRLEVLGPEHPDTITSENDIAVFLYNQRRFEEALQAYKQVLDKRKQNLGQKHPDTLQANHLIGTTLKAQGKFDEALIYYQDNFEKRKELLGLNHPSTLVSKSSIGFVLSQQGKLEEALQLHQEVFEVRKQFLDPHHPLILNSKILIACLFTEQLKYNEAIQILKEVFEEQQKYLGADHLNTLATKKAIDDIEIIRGNV